MTKLSPAAQAVLDAAYREMDYAPRRHVQWVTTAALRAAADQAAPEKQLDDIAYIHQSYVDGMRDALACIEIIADELEAL
jgi:hypothetical protein